MSLVWHSSTSWWPSGIGPWRFLKLSASRRRWNGMESGAYRRSGVAWTSLRRWGDAGHWCHSCRWPRWLAPSNTTAESKSCLAGSLLVSCDDILYASVHALQRNRAADLTLRLHLRKEENSGLNLFHQQPPPPTLRRASTHAPSAPAPAPQAAFPPSLLREHSPMKRWRKPMLATKKECVV